MFQPPVELNKYSLYPHGFIDKKAVLPADFCTLGIDRYIDIRNSLPDIINLQIDATLDEKILNGMDIKEVLFQQVNKWLNDEGV